MAASPWLKSSFMLILSISMLLGLVSSKSIPFSSSFVSFRQHEFWSANVLNNMPNDILSKLSPLSLNDTQYFTSLASKTPFVFDAKFCTLANLACAANLHNIKAFFNRYDPPMKFYFTFSQPRINHEKSLHIASSSQVDPFSFFRLSILKQGKRVHLPDLQTSLPSRAFLPFQIASKISLSLDELIRVFPESFVSLTTNDSIQMTLVYCHAPPLKGEVMSCTKSLEEMIGFSKNVLGQKRLLALTSKSSKGPGSELIVGSIKEHHDAKRIVSCHEVFLPFATYLCHLLSSTRLYAVDLLEPEIKVQVNRVVAVCHMDTSKWQKDHVAFKLLNISPGKGEVCHWFSEGGKGEVCHWFSEGDLAWIGA